MFDLVIANLVAGSLLFMSPEKELANTEKVNRGNYLQTCLERKQHFNTVVLSSGGIPGTIVRATT